MFGVDSPRGCDLMWRRSVSLCRSDAEKLVGDLRCVRRVRCGGCMWYDLFDVRVEGMLAGVMG